MLALSAELLVHIFGRYNQNIAKIWIFSPFSFSFSFSLSLSVSLSFLSSDGNLRLYSQRNIL